MKHILCYGDSNTWGFEFLGDQDKVQQNQQKQAQIFRVE